MSVRNPPRWGARGMLASDALELPRRSSPTGCFQCSKRRIVCDGGEPTCHKCQKKGIECSGLGRFRFYQGASIRGLSQGGAVPVTAPGPLLQSQSSCSGKQTPLNIRWQSDRPSARAKRKQSVRATAKAADASSRNSEHDKSTAVSGDQRSVASVEDNVSNPASAISLTSSALDEWCETPGSQVDDGTAEEVATSSRAIEIYRPRSISPWIPPLNSRTRMFLSHCKYSFAVSVH